MKHDLIEIVATVLNVPEGELTPESGPANLGKWDSLAHVTIVAAVEKKFSIRLTMFEMLSIKSLSDLQKAIEARGVS